MNKEWKDRINKLKLKAGLVQKRKKKKNKN